MATTRKRISELTALNSASLDTVIVGVDNGTTYKIELDVLADAVTSRVNILDRDRLSSLESVTSSFETKGRHIVSGSSQLTSSYDNRYVLSGSITQTTWDNIANKPAGIVSQSTDLTSLNNFTASISTASLVNRLNAIESVSGSWITENETGSFLRNLNGAISGAGQIADLGFVTGAYAYLNEFNSLTQSFNIISGSVVNITNAVDVTQLNTTTASLNSFSQSANTRLGNLEAHTSSYLTSLSGAISSSVQVLGGSGVVSGSYETTGRGIISSSANLVTTSSFNSYTASISTASLVTSITNLNSATSSYLTSLSGAISSSSQLTSSYDSRYVLSGSISAVPAGTISGSAQITALGFISSSTSVNTSSLATTGSNTFIGTETISGSLLLSGSFSYNGTPLQNGFAFAQPTLSKIVNNASYTGAAAWTGTYVGSGGAIIVRADVSGFRASAGSGTATLYRDNVAVASHTFYFNQTNTHTTLPAITYVSNSETGSHTYEVRFSNILADTQDYLTLTVLEYGNSAMFPTTIISGSSQLTSSFDTRYTLSGSISATPAGTISGSSQITSLGFVSGSYETTGRGIISSSTNLVTTSSFNSYTASISTASLVSSITNLNNATSSYLTSLSGAISSSSQLTSSYDTRYTLSGSVQPLPTGLISGSSQLTSSFDTRYAASGSGTSIPAGTVSGSSQLTSSLDLRYLVTGSVTSSILQLNTFTSSLNIWSSSVATTGSNSFNGSQTITGSLTVSSVAVVSASVSLPSGSILSLTSGSSLIVQNNGLVEITGSLKVSGSTAISLITPVLQIGTGSGDEGGELSLAKAITNTSLTGSGVTVDVYRDRVRIFEQGGDARGVYVDLSKTPAGVAGELIWKASGIVNAGTYVTLDNLKATVTTTGNRGLSLATVSGTISGYASGQYQVISGGANGSATTISLSTSASTSIIGWNFTGQGDTATYIIRDDTNNRVYRIIMIIGGSYNNNFISIERLY